MNLTLKLQSIMSIPGRPAAGFMNILKATYIGIEDIISISMMQAAEIAQLRHKVSAAQD